MKEDKIYFQYLYGQSRGNVTTLEYIDDSDPYMSLAVFSDGYKCNTELIDFKGNPGAYNSQMILARIKDDSQQSLWKFDEKEIKPKEMKKKSDDGNVYEAADPYFIDKNGNQIHDSKSFVNVTPPSNYSYIKFKEIPEKYYISSEYYQDTKTESTAKEQIKEESYSNEYHKKECQEFIEKPSTPKEDIQEDNSYKNSFIYEIYKNSKKDSTTIFIPVDINMPKKDVYNFINTNFGEDCLEEFITCIYNSISKKNFLNNIKDSIIPYYEEGLYKKNQ